MRAESTNTPLLAVTDRPQFREQLHLRAPNIRYIHRRTDNHQPPPTYSGMDSPESVKGQINYKDSLRSGQLAELPLHFNAHKWRK